jgi:hypothetical protein
MQSFHATFGSLNPDRFTPQPTTDVSPLSRSLP